MGAFENDGGKNLAELAAPAIFSLALYFGSVILPPLGLVAAAPLYYAVASRGFRHGVALIAVCIAVSFAGGGVAQAGFFFSSCAVMALSLGWAYHERYGLEKTVGFATLATFICGLLFYWIGTALEGKDMAEPVRVWSSTAIDSVIQSYRSVNADPVVTGWLEESRSVIVETFVGIFPAMMLVSVFAMAVVNVLVMKVVAMRFGLSYAVYRASFTMWKAPEQLVWLAIAGGAGALLADGMVKTAAYNLVIAVAAVYLVQGVAVGHFFLVKYNVPAFLRALGYFIVFSQPLLMLLVCGVGLADFWADFRKERSAGVSDA